MDWGRIGAAPMLGQDLETDWGSGQGLKTARGRSRRARGRSRRARARDGEAVAGAARGIWEGRRSAWESKWRARARREGERVEAGRRVRGGGRASVRRREGARASARRLRRTGSAIKPLDSTRVFPTGFASFPCASVLASTSFLAVEIVSQSCVLFPH
jgi:hypothetical protein